MGNKNAKQNSGKDRQALVEYLNGKGNLDKIWKQFDKDGNVCSTFVFSTLAPQAHVTHTFNQGFIDEKELEDLIYVALCFFCTERDPDMPEPPREQCSPFVKKILQDLKPNLDENDDGVISREEFELFGKYLNQEYKKLKSEIKDDGKGKKRG